ncbi:hypothetical protein QBC37DRAFT_462546 [Rhypophila decipiens]|uniref:Ubiquitin-like domain-containing protein n=1 Tax=Rhypophila decipiens TaxID=261697 RepID=A0AAN6XSW2_9PEZI|nr:hypothetical protein QBC37DRAFT_462546 [Rhypophila decipiens]
MRIFITITSSGFTFPLGVEPSDTIDSVKSQIQDKRAIPEESQRLLYADYAAEATLELIIRTRGSTEAQPVYRELGPSQSDEAVEERVKEWRAVAERDSFDDDLDIVDPDIYYRSLDILADKVAEYSEFKRCDGIYDLRDDITWDLETVPRHRFQSIPDTIWTAFVNLNQNPWLSSVHAAVAPSLWKTSLILSGVLSTLQQLQKANFCQSSFSLLLKRQATEAAEIIKIPIQDVDAILKGTLESLTRIHEGEFEGEFSMGLDRFLYGEVFEPCRSLLRRLYRPISGQLYLPTRGSILGTGRITAILLDIALVSYTGSHGCRIDADYLKRDARTFEVDPSTNLPGFRCSLRRLSCLEDFLDKREVWVFEFRAKNEVWETDNKRLGILTRIEDFADIWGPVYAIPGPQNHMIRQYNVSKGIICREGGEPPILLRAGSKNADTKDAIKCHWYNKKSWFDKKDLVSAEGSSLYSDDLLLIGGIMLENVTCRYTPDAYERDYRGDLTNELGTSGPSWQWDTRGVSFGFSKYVGITVAGTQKRIPDITLKEATLNKWLSNTRRRDPRFLNEYHGVEVSHCSGNARRIALRTLLKLSPLTQKIDLQFPGWWREPWGQAFWSAISGNDDSAIESVWTRFEEDRPQMGQIVAFTLDILSTTGLRDSKFTLAFLHKEQERSIDLEIRLNTWAMLLKETRSTTSFAMVSERCLLCNIRDCSSATCSESSAHKARTTLQSQIALNMGETSESRLASRARSALGLPLGNRAEYWQLVEVKGVSRRFRRRKSVELGDMETSGVILREETALDSALAILPARSGVVCGIEVRNPMAASLDRGSGLVDVYIQASEPSYGGMAKPRTKPDTVREQGGRR